MEIENTWKYIVYLTTNLNNNKIYIGVHKTDPNKFDGYIGCGVYINQSSSYQYPKTAFQYAVKKYGPKSFVRETIRIFDNEDDAYLLEERLVDSQFLARPDVYNLTLGGYNQDLNHRRKIYVYKNTGEYLDKYESIAECKRQLNITNIPHCLKLGICYKKTYYICYEKAESFDKARNIYIKNRPIYQFDSNGDFIKKFNHQYEAEEIYRNSNINLSIKTKTLDINNYYWGIEDVKKYNCTNKNRYNSKRKVGKYDLENNLVQVYESATMAANENGISVWKVLNGSNKTHKNHLYKYLS